MAFELISSMIHLLPTFHGLLVEDPNKYLKDFHVVCSSMKPSGISKDRVKLRAFLFSLADNANDRLYYLSFGSINTWEEMMKTFREKYFSASKANIIWN